MTSSIFQLRPESETALIAIRFRNSDLQATFEAMEPWGSTAWIQTLITVVNELEKMYQGIEIKFVQVEKREDKKLFFMFQGTPEMKNAAYVRGDELGLEVSARTFGNWYSIILDLKAKAQDETEVKRARDTIIRRFCQVNSDHMPHKVVTGSAPSSIVLQFASVSRFPARCQAVVEDVREFLRHLRIQWEVTLKNPAVVNLDAGDVKPQRVMTKGALAVTMAIQGLSWTGHHSGGISSGMSSTSTLNRGMRSVGIAPSRKKKKVTWDMTRYVCYYTDWTDEFENLFDNPSASSPVVAQATANPVQTVVEALIPAVEEGVETPGPVEEGPVKESLEDPFVEEGVETPGPVEESLEDPAVEEGVETPGPVEEGPVKESLEDPTVEEGVETPTLEEGVDISATRKRERSQNSHVADLPDVSRQRLTAAERNDWIQAHAAERDNWIRVQVDGLDADIAEKTEELEKLRAERSRYAALL